MDENPTQESVIVPVQRPNEQAAPPINLRLPNAPQRTTPGFVFPNVERAINDCLGRREFGKAQMQQVIEFFGAVPPECAFCGGRPVARWDHLIPITLGGETVLGNMVPSCNRCDHAKQHRPYREWMLSDGPSSLQGRGVKDIELRLEMLVKYAQHFGYQHTPLDQRLNHE